MLVLPRRAARGSKDGRAITSKVFIDGSNRLIQAIQSEQAQHRAKNLLLINAHLTADVGKESGPHPVAIRITFHHAIGTIEQASGPLRFGFGNRRSNFLLGHDIGLRPVSSLLIGPNTGTNFLRSGGNIASPLFGRAHQNDIRNRHTALSGRTKGRTNNTVYYLVFVRVGHHHHVIIGTGHALHALEIFRALTINMLAHRNRPDKRGGANILVFKQVINLVGTAVNNLHHAFRCTGFFKQLNQTHRGERVALGGFKNKSIAARNGQREHPQRNHRRKIKGRNAQAHADGLYKRISVNTTSDVLNRFTHHQTGDVGGVLDHFNATPNIPLGILKRLAQFLTDDFGNFVVVFFQQVLVIEHNPRPLRHRHFLPRLEGGFRRGDGAIHFSIRGSRHLTQHLLSGRINHGGKLSALTLNPLTVNK